MTPEEIIAHGWRSDFFQTLDHHPFVIATPPKCGSRTVKRFLLRAMGVDEAGIPDPAMHELCRARVRLHRFDHAERLRRLRTGPVFGVMREPLHRIASAFTDRVVRTPRRELNAPMFDAIRGPGHSADVGITFREFVEYLVRSPDQVLDQHWKPISHMFAGLSFDRLVELHDLPSLLAEIDARFGLRASPPALRPTVASAPWHGPPLTDVESGVLRHQGVLPPASVLYTPELERAVLDRYAADAALVRDIRCRVAA